MKKVILVITLASALVLVSTCAKREPLTEEGKCKLKYQQVDTSESTIYYARQDQAKLSEKPAQLKDLPKKISGQVSYFLAKIGDRDIPIVVDRANKYDLYLDTDGDGCLSDERSFSVSHVKKRFSTADYYRFGPISVEFDQPDGKLARRIYVITGSPNIEYLCICPADYRKGKILLGQNIYEVAVVDGNYDGKYDKIFSPPIEKAWRPRCDSFVIDLNRDGKLDWAPKIASELTPLSRMVKIENSYYSINVDPEGTTLELKKIEPEFGTLDLCGADIIIRFWSDAAEQYISGSEDNWQLPAGKYSALFIELTQKDTSGNRWTFSSNQKRGELEDFEIRSDQKSSFKIGPLFRIKTTARRSSNTVLIGFDLEGQASEQYTHGLTRNDIHVSAPLFKVIDEAGNVIDSGQFEYGRNWMCQYRWRVPKDFKGKYKVQIDMDLGPFEVIQDETWHVIE